MKLKKIFLIPLIAICLSGCSNNKKDEVIDRSNVDALLPTPITDTFKFKQAGELEGKRFAHRDDEPDSDHMGYVSLRSCTDGDTANFIQSDYKDEFGAYISIKTRFLGVNTPESTAKVEPWGKKASLFTKKVLTAAQEAADLATANDANKKTHYNIALINHPAQGIFDEKDSSGNRWLAFIWYRLDENSSWRLLNLELVEQAYSRNQLFVDDDVCDYRAKFEAAESRNSKGQYRLYGELDPDYDYEEITYEYSLWYIIHHFEEIGISESGSSGVQLLVTALVVGIQGDNMFLRDIFLDREQEDDTLAGLYCYAGYNSSLCSLLQNASNSQGLGSNGVGIIVRFYCRATYYNGNVQLSDLKYSTTGKKAFKTVKESNFSTYMEEYKWAKLYEENGSLNWSDVKKDITPTRIEPSTISKYDDPTTTDIMYDDLAKYQYQWVETEVVIRSVQAGEQDDDGEVSTITNEYWYKGNANDNSYTIYAYFNGKDGDKVLTNLRVDTSIYPFIEHTFWGTNDAFDIDGQDSPVGTTWHVTGYMALYYEKFQILLPNNYSDMNYVYKVS